MAAQAMHNASEKGMEPATEVSFTDANAVLASTVGNAKKRQLDEYTINQSSKTPLTTYTGVKVSVSRQLDSRAKRQDTEHSTFAGQRGPAILNDFHLREKVGSNT